MKTAADKQLAEAITSAGRRIAQAVCADGIGSSDAFGGHVESLTEAVMGVTGGLIRVSESIHELALAVSELASAREE